MREILGEAGGRDGRPIRELRRPRRVCARAAAILMIPVLGCGGITVEYMAREPCVPGRTCGEAWRTHRPFPIDRATPVPSDWSPGVERAPHTCAARQGRTPYVAATEVAPVSQYCVPTVFELQKLDSASVFPFRARPGAPIAGLFRNRQKIRVPGRGGPEDDSILYQLRRRWRHGERAAAADSDAKPIRSAGMKGATTSPFFFVLNKKHVKPRRSRRGQGHAGGQHWVPGATARRSRRVPSFLPVITPW